MNEEIIVVSAGTNSNQTKAQEYKVLSNHTRVDRIHSSSHRISELLKIVSDLKPEMITSFTADMNGRTIASFLEYFLSR